MVKAQWMMNGGKSSEDWDKLSESDVKLLIIDFFAKEEREMKMMAGAIGMAFSKKKGDELM